ncbi:hypothetical protein RAN3_2540 [plant metagenome]|uniref:Uncharacterized protein n=1 Tax=plant metagenome TaxID=1297885 RepID=A0A484U3G4_9ZZZZ
MPLCTIVSSCLSSSSIVPAWAGGLSAHLTAMVKNSPSGRFPFSSAKISSAGAQAALSSW